MSDRNANIAAALGLLLAEWRALSLAQQSALRRSTPTPGARRLQADARETTVRALLRKGLTGGDAGYGADDRTLTPEAMIMRAVGMRSEKASAQRRYSKRSNPAEKARQA